MIGIFDLHLELIVDFLPMGLDAGTYNGNAKIEHHLCDIGQQIGTILARNLNSCSKSFCLIGFPIERDHATRIRRQIGQNGTPPTMDRYPASPRDNANNRITRNGIADLSADRQVLSGHDGFKTKSATRISRNHLFTELFGLDQNQFR